MSAPADSTSTNSVSNPINLTSEESENVYCYRSSEQLKIAAIIANTLTQSFGSCFPEVHNQYKKMMARSISDESKIIQKKKGLEKFDVVSPQGNPFISASVSRTKVSLSVPLCLKDDVRVMDLQKECTDLQEAYNKAMTSKNKAMTLIHVYKLKKMKR